MDHAVDPSVDLSVEHVHEFLFHRLGVRPRDPMPGRKRAAREEPIFKRPAARPIARAGPSARRSLGKRCVVSRTSVVETMNGGRGGEGIARS